MKSPFPGMDPFIEAQHLWGDFHDNFIVEIQRAIQVQLPPRYVARIADRTFIETYDPDLNRSINKPIGPDVEIQRPRQPEGPFPAAIPNTAVADPPLLEMQGLVEFEERETYLDIYKLDPQKQLVTSVELLSPINKRRGTVGWDQYERKRNVFLSGYANLVEIDLLRGGRRHPMSASWPESPYAIAVVRREKAPICQIWPATSLEPLPSIPIPLLPPDADVVIPLQPIVANIYAVSRYAGDIDYTLPFQPPLSADEQTLLAEFGRRDRVE